MSAQKRQHDRVDDLRLLDVRQVRGAIDWVELGVRVCRSHGCVLGKRNGAVLFAPDEEHRNVTLCEGREAARGTGEHVSSARPEHAAQEAFRSEERRVGKEGRCWWCGW